MQKTKYIILVLFFTISAMQAQGYKGLGDQNLQAGFNFYGFGTGIKVSYDYGINDQFSVGTGVNFFNTGNYSSGFFIFGRGDYHLGHILDIPEIIDFYLGAELGLIGNSSFGLAGHFGGRYYLSNNIGAFVEIGSNGAIGLTINF